MPGLAGFIDLASGNAGKPDFWAFRAPDWTIAIPELDGRAGEARACRNDLCQHQEDIHVRLLAADTIAVAVKMPAIARLPFPHRCGSCGSRSRAIGESAAADWGFDRSVYARATGTAPMAMVITGLPVHVATVAI